jgi:cbb3-type cytochrome oxidase subunit 3
MGIAALGVLVIAMVLYRVLWFSRREQGRRKRALLRFKPKVTKRQ